MLTATSSKGQQPHVHHTPKTAGILLSAAVLWCICWFFQSRGYWEDDAWIHLEFARSVSQGLGFAFNGRVVAGDTAPLWVLLLAGLHALIPDWLAAGKLLTVLGAVFGLSGIYALARHMAHYLLTGRTARIFPAAIVLLVVADPYTCYWIFSGMEPVAAAGLACWAVLGATRERPTTRSFTVACLLAGLGPLIRPEMIFLSVLLTLPLFGQWRRLHHPAALKLVIAALGLLLLAGPLLAWSLYSLHAFGHLLPNTNAAKRAAPNESVLLRLLVIYLTGLPLVLGGVVAGLASLALHLSPAMRSFRNAIASTVSDAPSRSATTTALPASPRTLPPSGWIFILWTLASTLFYLADHTYVQTRYVLVAAPGMLAVILGLALYAWPRTGRLLYVAAMTHAFMVSMLIVVPFIHNKAANCEAYGQFALYMRNRLPPQAPVAVYSIGQIAFESQHPIVDTGGITRPGAIPYLNSPLGSMAAWAQSEGAQYYIEGRPPLPGSICLFSIPVPYSGWTMHTSKYGEIKQISVWQLPTRQAKQANDLLSGQPEARLAQDHTGHSSDRISN
jgi:hypothetical protein